VDLLDSNVLEEKRVVDRWLLSSGATVSRTPQRLVDPIPFSTAHC
jgi:hypothetical protein